MSYLLQKRDQLRKQVVDAKLEVTNANSAVKTAEHELKAIEDENKEIRDYLSHSCKNEQDRIEKLTRLRALDGLHVWRFKNLKTARAPLAFKLAQLSTLEENLEDVLEDIKEMGEQMGGGFNFDFDSSEQNKGYGQQQYHGRQYYDQQQQYRPDGYHFYGRSAPPPQRPSPFAPPPPRPTTVNTSAITNWYALTQSMFADYSSITSFPYPPYHPCTLHQDKCSCNIKAVFRTSPGFNAKKERTRWHPDKFSGCGDKKEEFEQAAQKIFVALTEMYEGS